MSQPIDQAQLMSGITYEDKQKIDVMIKHTQQIHNMLAELKPILLRIERQLEHDNQTIAR